LFAEVLQRAGRGGQRSWENALEEGGLQRDHVLLADEADELPQRAWDINEHAEELEQQALAHLQNNEVLSDLLHGLVDDRDASEGRRQQRVAHLLLHEDRSLDKAVDQVEVRNDAVVLDLAYGDLQRLVVLRVVNLQLAAEALHHMVDVLEVEAVLVAEVRVDEQLDVPEAQDELELLVL